MVAFNPEVGIGDIPSWVGLSIPLVALIGYIIRWYKKRNKNIANDIYSQGYSLYEKKDFRGSIVSLENAIKENPKHIKALKLKCKAFFEIQDYANALKSYEEAVLVDQSAAEELKDIKIKSEDFIKNKDKKDLKDLFISQLLEKAEKMRLFADIKPSPPTPSVSTKMELGGYQLEYKFDIGEHLGMFFVSITGTTEAIKKLNGIEGEIEKNLNPETISWQYTENGSDILIGSLIENSSIGYCDNESNWPIIQEKLITNMSRVENVLRQMIGKIATK